MSAGEQVALEPALAGVLAQDLHDPTVRREVLVVGQRVGHPGAVGDVEEGVEPVGGGFVGADDAKVAPVGVGGHHVSQEPAEDSRRFGADGPTCRDIDRVVAKVGQSEVLGQETTIGVGVRAHASLPNRSKRGDRGDR